METTISTSDRNGLFFVECVGGRWHADPVSYKSLAAAREQFDRDSAARAYTVVRLWDCTNSPIGTLLASAGR
jgi:hypothetical protein